MEARRAARPWRSRRSAHRGREGPGRRRRRGQVPRGGRAHRRRAARHRRARRAVRPHRPAPRPVRDHRSRDRARLRRRRGGRRAAGRRPRGCGSRSPTSRTTCARGRPSTTRPRSAAAASTCPTARSRCCPSRCRPTCARWCPSRIAWRWWRASTTTPRRAPSTRDFYAAVIHSRARLDYPGRRRRAGGRHARQAPQVRAVPARAARDGRASRAGCAQLRLARGSLDFDLPEAFVELDDDDPRLRARRAPLAPRSRRAPGLLDDRGVHARRQRGGRARASAQRQRGHHLAHPRRARRGPAGGVRRAGRALRDRRSTSRPRARPRA